MGPLIWKWEDEEEDGEGVGPYWIDVGPFDPAIRDPGGPRADDRG
jgi:hypothetical protein